jgi:GntR family transcriptional regulator
VVVLSRVAHVGEQPVVYGSNIVPAAAAEGVDLEGFAGSLHSLLEERCGHTIAYGVATLIPTVADRYLAQKLGVRRGMPLQLIEQINYDPDGRPVFLSREYWVPEAAELTIFRRRESGPSRETAGG